MKSTVYFLGAGASKDAGVPLSSKMALQGFGWLISTPVEDWSGSE